MFRYQVCRECLRSSAPLSTKVRQNHESPKLRLIDTQTLKRSHNEDEGNP